MNEEQSRRATAGAELMLTMLRASGETPEHRLMIAAHVVDELIGQVTDLGAARACVLTLTQTYAERIAAAHKAEGCA